MYWANLILASESHLREGMVNSPPPSAIIHLFQMAPENDSVRLQQIRRGNQLAISENADTIERLDQLMDVVQRAKRAFSAAFSAIESEVESLKRNAVDRERVLRDFNVAVGPIETLDGEQIQSRITGQEDVDHN